MNFGGQRNLTTKSVTIEDEATLKIQTWFGTDEWFQLLLENVRYCEARPGIADNHDVSMLMSVFRITPTPSFTSKAAALSKRAVSSSPLTSSMSTFQERSMPTRRDWRSATEQARIAAEGHMEVVARKERSARTRADSRTATSTDRWSSAAEVVRPTTTRVWEAVVCISTCAH